MSADDMTTTCYQCQIKSI